MTMMRIDDLEYPIFVGEGAPAELRSFIADRGATSVVVLADKKLGARAHQLVRENARTKILTFALGEQRKRLRTVETVLDALADAGADRSTLVIGVGGGVAGDLFGLCAALYMRGVSYVNVATSLVAMVDAAIGGKTGVDLESGKNLAGVFRDPVAVFCDVEALATLPTRHVREGLAEVVKHGIIEGGDAFEMLEALAAHPFSMWPWETVIAESVRIKAMYVRDDRLEAGLRETLNLGHTFGHAIEQVSGYRVAHGAAVSMGLRAAGLLALRNDMYSPAEHLRVLSLLTLLRLPLTAPVQPVDDLLAAMSRDKKTRGGVLRFVLPRAIGDVECGIETKSASVRAVLSRVVDPPGERELS